MNGHYYSQGFPRSSSFSTEPLGDHQSRSAWIQATEGQQNFHESIPMSRMSQGEVVSEVDIQLFPLDFPDLWNTQHSSRDATILERWFSQLSVEAVESPPISVTFDHPDQAQSVELRPSLSQMSFPISSGHSDTDRSFSVPDNTALYPDSPPYTDVQVYSESAYLDKMDSSVRRGSFHNGLPNNSMRRQSRLMPEATGSYTSFTSSGEEVMFTSPRDVMSQAFLEHSISQDGLSPTLDPLNIDNQPWNWDSGNEQSGLGVSSPFSKDDAWSVTKAPNYTTSSQSKRTNGKSTVPRNSCVSIEASATYQCVPEVTRFYSPTVPEDRTHGHRSIDYEPHPRGHALYQNATTHQDGLYHCPWEGKDPTCNHKPEKLKCNYDKFVDSHLKPYRCKVQACKNARFSSTACLLRHEREAHAMHGHGEKPFLCTFEGCERGQPGNGFPRHWNLCDHMKRVHNRSPSPSPGYTKAARGSKKLKKEASEIGSFKRSPVITSSSVEKQSAPVRTMSMYEQLEYARQILSSVLRDPFDPAMEEKLRNAEEALRSAATQMINPACQPRKIICQICFEEKLIDTEFPHRDVTATCTNHNRACRVCVSSTIKAAIDNGTWENILCPLCPNRLDHGDISEFATAEDLSRYNRLDLQRMMEGIPNFRWCLRGGCISGQIHDSGDSNPMMICAACGYVMCYTHQRPWHSGKTCKQVDKQRDGEENTRAEKASEEKIKELTKPCPKCQKPIEKIEGTCHHMKCRPPKGCGHEFCYDCLEPWYGYGKGTRHKNDCASKPS